MTSRRRLLHIESQHGFIEIENVQRETVRPGMMQCRIYLSCRRREHETNCRLYLIGIEIILFYIFH